MTFFKSIVSSLVKLLNARRRLFRMIPFVKKYGQFIMNVRGLIAGTATKLVYRMKSAGSSDRPSRQLTRAARTSPSGDATRPVGCSTSMVDPRISAYL